MAVIYKDLYENEKIKKFVEKMAKMTEENKLHWKKIVDDLNVYLTDKPFQMNNRDFYATIEHKSNGQLILSVDLTDFALINNASKTMQMNVMFKVESLTNSNNELGEAMRNLFTEVQVSIDEEKKRKLQAETERVESFIDSFIEEDESE